MKKLNFLIVAFLVATLSGCGSFTHTRNQNIDDNSSVNLGCKWTRIDENGKEIVQDCPFTGKGGQGVQVAGSAFIETEHTKQVESTNSTTAFIATERTKQVQAQVEMIGELQKHSRQVSAVERQVRDKQIAVSMPKFNKVREAETATAGKVETPPQVVGEKKD